MRLNNLNKRTKEEIESGNKRILLSVLKEELTETKEELIDLPLTKIEELRGVAKTLRTIIKLLEG